MTVRHEQIERVESKAMLRVQRTGHDAVDGESCHREWDSPLRGVDGALDRRFVIRDVHLDAEDAPLAGVYQVCAPPIMPRSV